MRQILIGKGFFTKKNTVLKSTENMVYLHLKKQTDDKACYGIASLQIYKQKGCKKNCKEFMFNVP